MHIIEDCKTLRDFLEQLVKAEKLKQFLSYSSTQGGKIGPTPHRENYLRPSLGTINVIMVAPGRTSIYQSEVMSVSNLHREILTPKAKRGKTQAQPTLSLLDEDKAGTHQPHDDALVVTI